jgi:hypothetical protein
MGLYRENGRDKHAAAIDNRCRGDVNRRGKALDWATLGGSWTRRSLRTSKSLAVPSRAASPILHRPSWHGHRAKG